MQQTESSVIPQLETLQGAEFVKVELPEGLSVNAARMAIYRHGLANKIKYKTRIKGFDLQVRKLGWLE